VQVRQEADIAIDVPVMRINDQMHYTKEDI
jgi:hypothetical protein